ncbi:MAG: transporter, family, putative rane transport protein [Thermoanaerobaculia bacterium]|jgi:predicted MFS family arabinose efflux permease|nr:transporter, family, putative rane transport protein [Thermoanaerobaculia bacterium]
MADFRRTLERAFRRRMVVKDTADAVVASGTTDEEAYGAQLATSSAAGTVALMLAGIAAFLNLYATQPLLPMLAKIFSASKAAVGMTVSAATLGVALSAPFCGLIAERVGRKRVIVTATLLLTIPTILASTATSLPMLIFWRFLQGLVMPGIFGVAIAYIAEEWPPVQVGRAMSLYVSSTVLGGFLGRILPGYAATHRMVASIAPSWRIGFLLIAACDLIFGVLIAHWLPRDRKTAAAPSRADGGMLHHLRNPRLVATYVVGFNVLFSLVAVFTYITFHLAAPPYHLTPAQLSSLFVVYLVGLIVTPLAGIGIGRAGSRPVLIVALIASMIGVSMTLLHSLPLILLGLVLCSSGVFVCQSASTSYIQTAAPAGGRASAAGLYVACYYAGGSVSGVLPGFFWRFGGWTACVALVMVVQAISIAVAAFGWRE